MENNGWIKLHRKLIDNPLWLKEPFTRGQAWIDLLLLANHKDGYIRVRGNRVDVKRGQVGWSQERLADRWSWSRGKVSRFLEELEKNEQQIEQQKNNKSSIITIVNYELYQQNGQQNEQQTDSRRTADGQQTDTNKNEKNVKKDIYAHFERFWKAYPRRKSRGQAEKAFSKINPDEQLLASMIAKIEQAKKSPEWLKDGGQFIPYPASWLNAKGWEDEIEVKQVSSW